ncbi:MAG: glycerophosphodiester phosphodiesterase family protein [Elusimicrobia bacterium]|nr:glycerophosphodiester phosphodiesterase family protein [Elusimicrobiota bacterium]
MKIIAHRGASGYAPENTLAAFELAVKMGASYFEFDVHRTRDGILVVHHDFDLKRTAAKEVKIAELSYAELKKINVAAHFAANPSFQRIPKLEEVMEIIEPAACWLNFEIKNDNNVYPGIEAELLAFLRSRPGLFEKALVSSFDYGTLKRLRKLSPELRLGYLGNSLNTVPLLPALKKAKAVGAVNFNMSSRLAFKLNVAALKKAGFVVYVYTVNDRKTALKMEKIGVDGIFSNYPDIMGKVGS